MFILFQVQGRSSNNRASKLRYSLCFVRDGALRASSEWPFIFVFKTDLGARKWCEQQLGHAPNI